MQFSTSAWPPLKYLIMGCVSEDIEKQILCFKCNLLREPSDKSMKILKCTAHPQEFTPEV